jgi:hypothetical protein
MLSSVAVEHTGLDLRQVAVWTGTGAAAWSSEAYRRIYARELAARLPDIRARFVGDLPDDRVAVSDRGDVVTSLAAGAGDDGPALAWLVAAAPGEGDLAAVCRSLERALVPPTLILSALSVGAPSGDGRESIARAITAALEVTVRDARSCHHVRPMRHGPVGSVPDPLMLLSRLTAPGVVRLRIEYLRTMDRYPPADTVLVEVSASQAGHLERLGRCVREAIARGYRFVTVAIPMHGESMTEELRRSVASVIEPVHCVDRLNLEDLMAATATAAAVVPISTPLLAAACAFGRPSWWCPGAEWDRDALIDGAPPEIASLIHDDLGAALNTTANRSAADSWRAQLDSHFDRIAGHLSGPVPDEARLAAPVASRVSQLEAAQRIAWRRLADERLRFAERAEGLREEIVQLKHDVSRRTAVEAALRQEMADALAHARHEMARADSSRQVAESAKRQLQADVAILSTEKAAMAGRAEALAALSRENADQAAYIDALTRERDELLAAVRRFEQSRSWRYLAPARAVGNALRQWLGITR